jgi:hypothetical protein
MTVMGAMAPLRCCASPRASFGARKERVIVGYAAIAEELRPGVDALDELYRLDASETGPEEEGEEEEEEEEEEDETFKPADRPHP